MVKYISQPQLFGQMLKLAVEFQDGIVAKVDKTYRVLWAKIRFKEQIEPDKHLKYVRHWKLFGLKFVCVRAYVVDKEFKVHNKATAWFVLGKKK